MNTYLNHQPSLTTLPPSFPAGPHVRTWQWFFLGSAASIRSYTPPASIRDYLTSGTYQFSFSGGETPGAYGITFMRSHDDTSGNSSVWAVTTIRLLPPTHARCVAINNAAIVAAATQAGTTPSCGSHGTIVNLAGVYSCQCDQVIYSYV